MGRINQRQYLVSLVSAVFYSIIMGAIAIEINSDRRHKEEVLAGTIFFVGETIIVWFFASKTAQRLHDCGYSGWYQLLPIYYIMLLFIPSQPNENKYGKPAENEPL